MEFLLCTGRLAPVLLLLPARLWLTHFESCTCVCALYSVYIAHAHFEGKEQHL